MWTLARAWDPHSTHRLARHPRLRSGHMHRYLRLTVAASLLAVTSLAAACSSGGSNKPTAANGPVTLTWWHNATADPGLSAWQKVADDYHAAHPNVSFKITPIQNEQFTSKVPAALESNDPP